jgi:uncharacterized membrane protein
VNRGVLAATLVLAGFVAAFGPALTALPIDVLRLVVGSLLLVFGLQWVRKGLLRAAGFKALHDEEEIFARQAAAARGGGRTQRSGVADWYAFTLAFKAVLLEGLEVAFIVVTFGANQHRVGPAVVGAVAAVLVVVATGFAVRAPLARVPENTMKLAVGCLLTTFGTFWAAEGAGAEWPGRDGAIAGLLAFYAVVMVAAIKLLRTRYRPPGPVIPVVPGAGARMSRLRAFAAFWYDFLVGDDWRSPLLVAVGLGAAASLNRFAPASAWWPLPVAVVLGLDWSMHRAIRRHRDTTRPEHGTAGTTARMLEAGSE